MSVINHRDEKASKIKNFPLLANIMWRRAFYLAKENFKESEKIYVIDPCCGGGSLLYNMDKGWYGKAYEPNYGDFMFADALLDQKNYDVDVINEPFEFHFSTPFLPEFHIAITIPYTDRQINVSLEQDASCVSMKNYAYYIMNRTLDILQVGGYGVFALPKSIVNSDVFQEEVKCMSNKSTVINSESFEDYAIITIKKEK